MLAQQSLGARPSTARVSFRRELALAGVLMLVAGCQSSEARLELRDAQPASAPTQGGAPAPAPAPTGTSAPQEAPPTATPAPEEGWRFHVMPYVWLAGIQGTVFANNVGISFQRSFSELTDNLEFGGSLRAEAREESWSVLFDSTYIELEGELASPGGDATMDLDNLFLELDLGYSPEKAPSLTFLVGARLYDEQQRVTLPLLGTREAGTTLIDPILGARGTWDIGDHFLFSLRGDIGGFGVSSEFTSQIDAYFRWMFSKVGGLNLGYRVYTYEIDKDDVDLELRMGGPTFGLDFSF